LVALVSLGAVVAGLGGLGTQSRDGRDPSPSSEAVSNRAARASSGAFFEDRQSLTEASPAAKGAPPMAVAPSIPGSNPASGVPEAPVPAPADAGSAAVTSGGGAAAPDRLGGPPLPQAVAAGNSRIVKTAAVDLTVGKGRLAGVEQQALDAVTAAGGWVQSSDMGADQAHLVLKVPSDRLEGVVSSLKKLGKVRAESMAGEDVTAQFVDLEARLKHWQAQEGVFLGLMARAKTIPETIQIQQQLSQIQEQIEQLEGQRRYLDGQTSFSTIRLGLLEAGAVAKQPEEASPSILARAWERAAGAALAVLGGTLVVLGAAVPLAFVLGIPTLLVLAALRRRSGVVVPPV
jgi:hypothetical protein